MKAKKSKNGARVVFGGRIDPVLAQAVNKKIDKDPELNKSKYLEKLIRKDLKMFFD